MSASPTPILKPVGSQEIDLSLSTPIKSGLPRSLDIALALIALVISTPLLGAAAAAIFLSTHGPVFFCQTRIGQRGRPFTLYKIRTMKVLQDNSPEVTASDDSRILAVGRWLRKTKLDELPELWNVVKGDMSLVGPRPEVERYVDRESPLWKLVLEARPGITDPVTLSLRNEETLLSQVNGDREYFYLHTLQPFKLKGYLSYLSERSIRRDFRILWQTYCAVVMPSTAPAPTIKVE